MNFTLFICYYEFTQESPEKEKKGVETPDLIIALLYDIIFINTHENEFYTFYLYIYVIMNYN